MTKMSQTIYLYLNICFKFNEIIGIFFYLLDAARTQLFLDTFY